ncbi:hypothetical protein [Streptomyces flavidovirens]
MCPDCLAGPDPGNDRVGRWLGMEIWHTPDCPQFTIMKINWEAGSRRIKEQDEWAEGVFPAAHERLQQAGAAMRPGTARAVHLCSDRTGPGTGRHHRLRRPAPLAEILERHFRPQLPDPDHTTA